MAAPADQPPSPPQVHVHVGTKGIVYALILIAIPFIYTYCWLPIQAQPMRVNPAACLSTSTMKWISGQLQPLIVKDIATDTANTGTSATTTTVSPLNVTVTGDYPRVLKVNRNNGHVTCYAYFHAAWADPKGKVIKTERGEQFALYPSKPSGHFSIIPGLFYACDSMARDLVDNA